MEHIKKYNTHNKYIEDDNINIVKDFDRIDCDDDLFRKVKSFYSGDIPGGVYDISEMDKLFLRAAGFQ